MSEEIRELLEKAERRIEELEKERRVIGLNTNGKTYYIKPSSIDAVEVVRWNPDAGHPCTFNVYMGGGAGTLLLTFNSRELLEDFLKKAGMMNEDDAVYHHDRNDGGMRTASDPGRGSVER